MALDLNQINFIGFPEDQYYREEHPKDQIVLHHTASGKGANGDFQWWLSTPGRIATFMIIDWEGKYFQCFSSKYWAHHIGMRNGYNRKRNQRSIAIEIDSWGPLARVDDKFHNYLGQVVNTDVTVYPEGYRTYPDSPAFRRLGVVSQPCKYYESYTRAQIDATAELINYLCKKYYICKRYNPDMWEYNVDAVKGKPGIWSHVSYRKDKIDCHPQPELIKMLKSL